MSHVVEDMSRWIVLITLLRGIWYTVLSHKDSTSLSHKSEGFYFILKFVISGYLHMGLLQEPLLIQRLIKSKTISNGIVSRLGLSTSSHGLMWLMIKCFQLILHVHNVMLIPMRSQPSGERNVYIEDAQQVHVIGLNDLWNDLCRRLVDSISLSSQLFLRTSTLSTFTNFGQQIQDDQCFNLLLWCYHFMCTLWTDLLYAR